MEYSITDTAYRCLYQYSPTNGTTELRTAIAKHYNETYRVGKESQYTFRNVAVVPGGRAGLTRVSRIFLSAPLPTVVAFIIPSICIF